MPRQALLEEIEHAFNSYGRFQLEKTSSERSY
jgi:hypothetical protein